MKQTFSVAVLGQGTVGSEVIEILHKQNPHLEDVEGKPIELKDIHRKYPQNAGDFYTQNPHLYKSIDEIIADEDTDCVCELMGGIDTARSAIERALSTGKHIVSAVIEYDQDVDMPSELWFRVDEEFASHVSTRADAFVSCLLSVARELREDIEICADFSPQLLIGLQELQYIQEAWFKQNRLISLKANNLVPSVAKNNNSVNSCNI